MVKFKALTVKNNSKEFNEVKPETVTQVNCN